VTARNIDRTDIGAKGGMFREKSVFRVFSRAFPAAGPAARKSAKIWLTIKSNNWKIK